MEAWEMMKKISVRAFAILAASAGVLVVPSSLQAQDAAALYKSKCAGCHGADGTGSPMGKKMGAQDFTSNDVQSLSDAQLSDAITNGKGKMPAYKSLTPDQVKGLVAYIRTLKK
jgi:cytochrome c6